MTESWKRSAVKTVSWRITATAATVAIVYALTGSVTLSLEIGSLELVLKMALFYAHERAWSRTWGTGASG
jgi:uncharacterized membrane protein